MCVAGGTLNLVPVFLFLDPSDNFSVKSLYWNFIDSYVLTIKI